MDNMDGCGGALVLLLDVLVLLASIVSIVIGTARISDYIVLVCAIICAICMVLHYRDR